MLALLLASLASCCLAGCKHQPAAAKLAHGKPASAPVEAAAMDHLAEQIRQRAEQELPAEAPQQLLPDSALVLLHQTEGFGIGLKIPVRHVHLGQPIVLHAVYEDLDAPIPLANSACTGLSAAWIDLSTGAFSLGGYSSRACADGIATPSKLIRGRLYTFDFPMSATRTQPSAPGRYAVSLSWQPTRFGASLFDRDYRSSASSSNLVEVDVDR